MEKSPVDSADTLWVKNFVKIARSRSISEINTLFVFNAEIQEGRQTRRENVFCEMSPIDSGHILCVKNFVKIAPSRSVSEINVFLRLTQKFKMASKSGRKRFFGKSPVDSADTLWVKNFVEIALSRSISEINRFLRLTQKFKMATKSGGKTIFAKSHQ